MKTNTYKSFREAFDIIYAVKKYEHDTKQASKKYQNEVDQAISYEMQANGLTRNQAILKLYPNG